MFDLYVQRCSTLETVVFQASIQSTFNALQQPGDIQG